MTATPIPRTLALSLYGDLDLSVIDELPPGRQPIKTRAARRRTSASMAYELHPREVGEGRQAFVICPLVEESEKLEARAATAEYERLSRRSSPTCGRPAPRADEAGREGASWRASGRELDVLVSTAVVEVGIDMPNASVMLIEGAERFGLAQLHQFRGRVGRGADQLCMLLTDGPRRRPKSASA